MKMLKYKITGILLVILCVGLLAKTEVSKEYHEKYPTDKQTSFLISNKYGQIDIKNTKDNEMTIDVIVKVGASSESKAQKILDDINIKLSKSGNKIEAITEIGNTWQHNNVSINIDYVILMPSYIKTDLTNKYGDVTINTISGPFDGEVKYGNLSANSLVNMDKDGVNTLEVAYCGQVSVKSFSQMKLTMGYSKANLGTGDNLVFNSKYSDIKIGDVALVKGYLTYGDLKLNSAMELRLEAKYSDIKAELVNSTFIVTSQYGDVRLGQLMKGFDQVRVDVSYSDVRVGVESGAEYQLNAKASYGDVRYPSMQVTASDHEGTKSYVVGYVGSQATTSKIDITASYGDVNISEL
jgi:hypothetical protein